LPMNGRPRSPGGMGRAPTVGCWSSAMLSDDSLTTVVVNIATMRE
jgi:hypothetical protein